MMGLLSAMDALLNLPMENLLEQIAVADEVKQALLNHEGNLGMLLDDTKNFMTGEWEQLEHQSESEDLAAAYGQSLCWVIEAMKDLHNV
jgi:c-di-GMP-related signal transduction protein